MNKKARDESSENESSLKSPNNVSIKKDLSSVCLVNSITHKFGFFHDLSTGYHNTILPTYFNFKIISYLKKELDGIIHLKNSD